MSNCNLNAVTYTIYAPLPLNYNFPCQNLILFQTLCVIKKGIRFIMKVIVIGGGPAGMMSAISASKNKNEVIILEKNKSLGKKLLITGKGRCNITSSKSIDEFINNIPGNR